MNRGLLLRALREMWATTAVIGLLLLVVEGLLAFVLPKFAAQLPQQWLELDFARGILQAMLGTEVRDRVGPEMFQSVAWVHPAPLALLWAHAIMLCTRVPAGEVDRGTIDVLLGLPVSRWEIFFSETAVWLGGAVCIFIAAHIGNLAGSLSLPAEQRPELGRTLIVLANLFCLYGAVGGFAWLISSVSDRRGRAMTFVFLVLLGLFLLTYLTQFWQPLDKIALLSPLHYHRPVYVLGTGAVPWRDMLVLGCFGLAAWITGGVIFARRGLCTV